MLCALSRASLSRLRASAIELASKREGHYCKQVAFPVWLRWPFGRPASSDPPLHPAQRLSTCASTKWARIADGQPRRRQPSEDAAQSARRRPQARRRWRRQGRKRRRRRRRKRVQACPRSPSRDRGQLNISANRALLCARKYVCTSCSTGIRSSANPPPK